MKRTKKPKKHDPRIANSYEELGLRLDCGHHSLPRWRRVFADAPAPRANGGHSVTEWQAFFARHPEIKLESRPNTPLEEEKLRKLRFENNIREGKFLAGDYVTTLLTEVFTLVNSTLRTKLEDELPPILAGMTAPAIRLEMKKVHDEICRLIQEGTRTLSGPT